MQSALVVFDEVGTNRRVLVNFGQVTHVQAGGVTSVIFYSDGSHTVVKASFGEICTAVDIQAKVA